MSRTPVKLYGIFEGPDLTGASFLSRPNVSTPPKVTNECLLVLLCSDRNFTTVPRALIEDGLTKGIEGRVYTPGES